MDSFIPFISDVKQVGVCSALPQNDTFTCYKILVCFVSLLPEGSGWCCSPAWSVSAGRQIPFHSLPPSTAPVSAAPAWVLSSDAPSEHAGAGAALRRRHTALDKYTRLNNTSPHIPKPDAYKHHKLMQISFITSLFWTGNDHFDKKELSGQPKLIFIFMSDI